MRPIDNFVFFLYLAGVLCVGFLASRRKQSRADYLSARHSFGWVTVGLSVMATVFSAVNFAAFTGEVISYGLYVVMVLPVFFLVIIPVTRYFIPFHYGRQSVSAYEFLEERFDGGVRRLASAMFIVWRLLWVAMALYATGRLLQIVFGFNLYVLVVFCGLVATAYTAAGGMRAVVWTDVFQVFILVFSLLAGIIYIFNNGMSFPDMMEVAYKGGILKPFSPFDKQVLSFDPSVRMTVWSCLTGAFVAFVTRYGVDQMVVQRYFAAKTLDHARRSLVLSVFCSVFVLLCMVVFGIMAYAGTAGPGAISGEKPAMKLLGEFIISLPGGLTGFLFAGLAASTMSSVDSGIHSCWTAMTTDFPMFKRDEKRGLAVDRFFVVVIGVVTTFCACFIGRLGSIFETANRVINGMGSPLFAVVLLGMYGRGVTARGVFLGGLAGLAASVYVCVYVDNLALHYYAVVNFVVTIFFCYAFSMGWQRGKR